MLFIVFIALCIPGVWAILMMKNSINILPDVRNNAVLLSRGIYKYIRHPMYFSVLSVCLLWLIHTYTFVRLIIWIVLLIDMILKMNFEEAKLSEAFDNYEEYRSRTSRLIPYIY
jgi:protein-S-isoprenylcysteine O-methyltransferase Ste14